MIDLNALANSTLELIRQHGPWLGEKVGAVVAAQAAKDVWEQVKKKLLSPGGQEAVHKVESEPAKDRNWDTLKNHLLDALEQDAAFREQLSGVLSSAPVQQTATGDRNKQAVITDSPGARIKM